MSSRHVLEHSGAGVDIATAEARAASAEKDRQEVLTRFRRVYEICVEACAQVAGVEYRPIGARAITCFAGDVEKIGLGWRQCSAVEIPLMVAKICWIFVWSHMTPFKNWKQKTLPNWAQCHVMRSMECRYDRAVVDTKVGNYACVAKLIKTEIGKQRQKVLDRCKIGKTHGTIVRLQNPRTHSAPKDETTIRFDVTSVDNPGIGLWKFPTSRGEVNEGTVYVGYKQPNSSDAFETWKFGVVRSIRWVLATNAKG